ncbi:hypothetical protein [Thalassococcus sp. S3]|nr:hypothetical protein [Thalassococcus sp. S3]QBF29950.1 hypothetical protein CFI11_24375 [Thalassococcus sp. S3]
MDVSLLVGGLALLTISAVIIFAVTSKRKVEKRMRDENAEPSSLAKDG